MKFKHANDIAMHYTLSGSHEQSRLVFINSLGTDLRIWDDVITALSKDYQCLCYDKRGHGLSDGDEDAYSIDLLTDDLVALLDTLGWDNKIIVIGLSVGGLIAQNFAYRFPERLSGLVLMDTAAKIGTPQSWNERISFIRSNGLASISQKIMERWLTPVFEKKYPEAYAGYSNMLERTSAQAYCATCIALRDSDLTEQTKTLDLPTLVLAGQDDSSTPPELVQNTAALIKNAEFHTIAACGHLPCIEQPDITIKHLKTFISESIYG